MLAGISSTIEIPEVVMWNLNLPHMDFLHGNAKYPTWQMVSDFTVHVHVYYLSKTWAIWVGAKQYMVWCIVWFKNGTTFIKEFKP